MKSIKVVSAGFNLISFGSMHVNHIVNHIVCFWTIERFSGCLSALRMGLKNEIA